MGQRTAIAFALALLVLFPAHGAFSQESGRAEEVYAVLGADGVQRVELVGGDYYFEPSHIVLVEGVPAEITVRKVPGIVPHNIVMDSPEAGMVFSIGFGKDGEVIRFTPSKAGKYPFFCDKKLLFFESHREKGMEGVIEVVPNPASEPAGRK